MKLLTKINTLLKTKMALAGLYNNDQGLFTEATPTIDTSKELRIQEHKLIEIKAPEPQVLPKKPFPGIQ